MGIPITIINKTGRALKVEMTPNQKDNWVTLNIKLYRPWVYSLLDKLRLFKRFFKSNKADLNDISGGREC